MGRVKGRVDTGKLEEAMEGLSEFESTPFSAGEVVLFQSDLRPSGAVYTRLRTASLQ